MRQAFAVGILAIAVLAVWTFVIWPILDLPLSTQADVDALTDQLRRLRTIDRRAPLLGNREQTATATLKSLDVFWSGASDAAIAALMQDVIRNAAQQSGGTVTSSSVLTQNAATPHSMLAVRARVDGSLDTLIHVLAAVDAARPRLFVSEISISSALPSTPDRPPPLSFEFSTSGYIAGSAHAH